MKSIHPKETSSKTVEKSEEKEEELKTSNGPKEDGMSRCLAELEKLMNILKAEVWRLREMKPVPMWPLLSSQNESD
ncbi:unnamed protein product [Caenorhabditis brenneri]